MGVVTREGGGLKDGAGRTNKCPLQDEEAEELSGKGHRAIESPGVGGSLVQLRNQTEGREVSSARKAGSGRIQSGGLDF